MGAAISPYNLSIKRANTGLDYFTNMGATSMIILCPKRATWTDSDLADFTGFLTTKFHTTPSARFYPLFGAASPIRQISNNKESEVIQTFDDGSQAFIRYGKFSRTLSTSEGGIALGQSMATFIGTNYAFIEVDNKNQVAFMKNVDGTYSGFPVNLAYAPLPDLADFKSSYLNHYLLNFNKEDYIDKGYIRLCYGITDLNGLIDVDVVSKGAATTTVIKVGVLSDDASTDLFTLYPNELAKPAAWVVTKKSDGTIVTLTSAPINNTTGGWDLTGTFTSTAQYVAALASPAILSTLVPPVKGYETLNPLTVTIP